MISCFLQGGLGNQMFQIATTVAHAIKNNTDYGINLNMCHTPNQGNVASVYSNTIFSKINKISHNEFDSIYDEPKFSFTPIPFKDKTILRGYFQSSKYFDDYKDFIINLFEFPKNVVDEVSNFILEKELSNENLTCLHIRRGDYLKFSFYHEVCNLNYYLKACQEFDNTKFIIVTDDKNWVKNNFDTKDFIVSELSSEISDLYLMTISDNLILSNSTFSWWGSYLNKKKTKKVISPFKWFNQNGPDDTQDIYMNDWKKLEF
jgi:hypothetical protein